MDTNNYSRRDLVKLLSIASLGAILTPTLLSYIPIESINKRMIHSTGELLPIVGLGTWQTFDVPDKSPELKILKEVLNEMTHYGARLIDSSPMYGNSERTVGHLTKGMKNDFFYATKVWTTGKESGIRQMNTSLKKMNLDRIDLMQIHNLIDWKTHIKTLRDWKDRGKIRYWGITHYTDASHSTLEKIIQSEKPDFVQFNYSIEHRNAESSLLETCRKNKTAVIINRPFGGGSLFKKVRGENLPKWCPDQDINSWAQFFLKFILSNEAVTCVIPGTSKPNHMADNMMAGYGKLPDKNIKAKMLETLKNI